jgi:Flp pilus assembly protein TadD
MSLVNDMLKDLDRRRSGSETGGAKVRLTPASEFPKVVAKIIPAYLLAGLVVVAAVLGYTWLQLSSNSGSLESRPLNRPSFEVANQQGSSRSVTEAAEARGVTAQPPLIQQPITSAEDILSQVVQQRSISQANVNDSISPAANLQPAIATRIERPSIKEPSKEELVNIRGGAGVDDSVKHDAVISEDQQDTMAVQESLRLLADNQMAEAYANLEKHIEENRYAHQSRETYAKLLVNDGELQSAYNLIEQGLQLAPNNSGFKKIKARVLIKNGQLLDAVELLVAKAPPVIEDIEYHEILASAQLATKDFAGASISYSELVGADQTQGKFWYGYAAAQELLGNPNVARQAYARAVQQASLSTNLRRRSQDRLLALRE